MDSLSQKSDPPRTRSRDTTLAQVKKLGLNLIVGDLVPVNSVPVLFGSDITLQRLSTYSTLFHAGACLLEIIYKHGMHYTIDP